MSENEKLTFSKTVDDETLLKAVYESLKRCIENDSTLQTSTLPMLLCKLTSQIQLLEDKHKIKLFLFSKACNYTINQLNSILDHQYNFFYSYIFFIKNFDDFDIECKLIISNPNLWELFILFPNTAKKLITHFRDDKKIDKKAEKLLSLIQNNSSFSFLKTLLE